VTGHSGAGKSTLLKLVLGIEKPSGGKLVVNGNEMGLISPKMLSLHRRQVGTVFQDHQLLNDRSVYDNVALPLEISGLDPREGKRRVRAALDKVGLLSKEKLLPMALSGGEQQRVGIARAVVNTPRIILADEPTGNLDPELSAEIMALFAQFMSVGVSLLVASHDRALIDGLGYRILTLEEGRLGAEANPHSAGGSANEH
jgi:cell division transport system ATP-binding protein